MFLLVLTFVTADEDKRDKRQLGLLGALLGGGIGYGYGYPGYGYGYPYGGYLIYLWLLMVGYYVLTI